MVIRKIWWVWFMLCELTYVCCCRVYLPAAWLVVVPVLAQIRDTDSWFQGI